MIKVTLGKKNPTVQIDIELPEGEKCDEVDAKVRTMLALLGVTDKSVLDDVRRTKVPDGTPTNARTKGR